MKKGLSPERNDAGPAVLKRHTGVRSSWDEIGNMPLEVQEKTLRLVEYGTFERVGSSESIDVDVRLVAGHQCGPGQTDPERTFQGGSPGPPLL